MTTVGASVHRLRSWAVAVAVLLSTLVAGVPSTSMEWPGSQALCADVAVTVAVNPDHAPTADLLDYRITAGHSHGPPVAINGPAPNGHTYYVLAGDTPVLVHNCNKNQGVYEFPDQWNPGQTYVGSTHDFAERLATWQRKGRLGSLDDATCTHVCGTRDDVFVAEHLRIEELRQQGVSLSNKIASPGKTILGRRWEQLKLW